VIDLTKESLDLSLEQSFSLARYKEQVKGLSAEQAQEMLVETLRQIMIKDNVIRHLVKESIGAI
jgi:Phycobilisome degradation protein nblA